MWCGSRGGGQPTAEDGLRGAHDPVLADAEKTVRIDSGADGAFRARQLAVKLVRERGCAEALVRLGWTPGDATPAHREALLVDAFGLARPLPERDLPPADWFSIEATVRDLGLVSLPRRRLALDGYFASWNGVAPPG